MSVLSQSLLTLVCSHLVAFFLLTVWHNSFLFKWFILIFSYNLRQLTLFHFLNKLLSGLETGKIVCSDSNSCILLDVAGCFLCTMLDDETAKTAQ